MKYSEKIREQMEKLEEGLQSISEQDDLFKESLQLWGKMAAMRHTYSLQNTLLAAITARHHGFAISFLGSFDYWKKVSSEINKMEGNKKWKWYGVQKGSKSLPCIYPIFKKVEDGDEKRSILVGFGKGSTFDISQTGIDMEKLESLNPKPLEGRSFEDKKQVLVSILEDMEYKISFESLNNDSLGGYIVPSTKNITINSDRGEDHQLKTLFHEFAHGELGHGIGGDHGIDDVDRGAAEVQAESVAFILADLIGMDTSQYSFKYVLTWGRNDLDFIRDCAVKTQKVLNKVLERLEKAGFMAVEEAA